MTASFPPSGIQLSYVKPDLAALGGNSLSPPLEKAFDMLSDLSTHGIALAPAMPNPNVLKKAADQAGISVQDALNVYLTILNHD